jgi:hypothetical protein
MNADSKCEVCGFRKAVGVACTSMPYSCAFCIECLRHGADPELVFICFYDDFADQFERLADGVADGLTTFKNGKYISYREWTAIHKQEMENPMFYPPHVVSQEVLQRLVDERPEAKDAYKQVTPQLFILEARIEPKTYAVLPHEIKDQYAPIFRSKSNQQNFSRHPLDPNSHEPFAWWLRLETVPESERVRYPTLRRKITPIEADALLEFSELYDRIFVSTDQVACVLRKENEVWSAGS